ncbi:nitronate monooxygenase [Candidatus Sumerlaeota bacterium]|nr:nitronate monooxygenase [Candidatus Sumerlaeota bacterium]
MLKTKITEMFGIEYPIVMGGMQWVGRAGLVAAVSNAGGIGFLTALTQPTPEELAKEIGRVRDLTDKPFGVNLTILPTLKPVSYDDYQDVIVDAGIKFVETAGRNPEPFLPKFKAAGIKIIHKCTSVRHALKAERIGCDVISIDGFECAGHPGEDDVTSLILIPCTANVVKIPLIASGGFGDARGLIAALALGADAMNMGTRFCATQEAPIHMNVKQLLVDNDERSTKLIMRSLRNTERVVVNDIVDKVLEIESKGNATIDDIKHLVSGKGGKKMFDEGDTDAGVMSAGQVMGLIRDIPSCQELIDRIMSEAEEVIQDRLGSMMGQPVA